jgi:hypothetical protein
MLILPDSLAGFGFQFSGVGKGNRSSRQASNLQPQESTALGRGNRFIFDRLDLTISQTWRT